MNTSKQINIMITLVFLSVLALAGYTLWDSTRANDAEARQQEGTVRRGAYIFSQYCRACHGDAGEGGAAANRLRQAPALNRPDLQGKDAEGNTTELDYAKAYKLVFNTISCGRVGKVMPTWAQSQGGSLTDEQIKQLTVFITKGTGWEEARDFGLYGAEEFHITGDDRNRLSLARAATENDTTLTLNHVVIETHNPDGSVTKAPVVNKEERLETIDAEGKPIEIMRVIDVNADDNTVTVERGVGTTSPTAIAEGTAIFQPPTPPQDPPVVEQACGQTAGAPAASATPPPVTANPTIIAKGTAWNTALLSVPAGQPITITVDNQDVNTTHDWHLTQGKDPGGADVAATDIEPGPVQQTLTFGPLAAGDYYYLCDVHPSMEGVLTAFAPGTGPTTTGGGTTASQTPAAGGTPAAATTPTP